jgi:hypothetical protein
MTPDQALQILVQMAAMAHATKADHLAAEQAAAVLRTEITSDDADDAKISPEER